MAVLGRDPAGNPRTIPVRITSGSKRGLVVMHSRQELERLWKGVEREVSEALGREERE